MPKAAEPENVTTIFLLRQMLGLTQSEVGFILGLTLRSVWKLDHHELDTINFGQIRALYNYAIAEGLDWPDDLLTRLVQRDPTSPTIPKRLRKRKA